MTQASSIMLPDDLVKAIHRAETITFDIFDTALVRAVENPVDLFLILAHEANLAEPKAWARARVAAERLARERAWVERQGVEVTLSEVYASLGRFPEAASTSLDDLMALERALELRVARRQPLIWQAYEFARELGKRLGFISDMYLDQPLIADMLDQCGYRDYEFLLVSSAIGKTKANGDLYLYAQVHHAVNPSRQLHIGDNYHSDIQQAKAAGAMAFHVPKNADRLTFTQIGQRLARVRLKPVVIEDKEGEGPDEIWRSLWRGLVASRLPQPANIWYELGYSHVGMLLLGFAFWLEREAVASRVSRLCFLARDGHVMQRVHEQLRRHGLARIPSSYLYASRRAWNVPALIEVDETACDFLVSGTSRLTVGEFLSRVGLTADKSLSVIDAMGFNGPDHRVLTGEDYGRLRAVFRELAPELLLQAAQERVLIEHYWQQDGLFDESHIGLVDVGWHGSLQESFSRLMTLFGHQPKVTGFYVGTFAAARAREDGGARHRAYLCQGGVPVDRLAIIRTSVEVFEWLFCAPHGSVLGFHQVISGRVDPFFESGDLESAREVSAARMQDGALQFINDVLGCFSPGVMPPPIPTGLEVSLLHDLLKRPTAAEARLLGDLPHAEGFGGVSRVRAIARPEANVLNPLAWPVLMRGYRQAFWRRAYLQRLMSDAW